jgi:hypothetical protein
MVDVGGGRIDANVVYKVSFDAVDVAAIMNVANENDVRVEIGGAVGG